MVLLGLANPPKKIPKKHVLYCLTPLFTGIESISDTAMLDNSDWINPPNIWTNFPSSQRSSNLSSQILLSQILSSQSIFACRKKIVQTEVDALHKGFPHRCLELDMAFMQGWRFTVEIDVLGSFFFSYGFWKCTDWSFNCTYNNIYIYIYTVYIYICHLYDSRP